MFLQGSQLGVGLRAAGKEGELGEGAGESIDYISKGDECRRMGESEVGMWEGEGSGMHASKRGHGSYDGVD